MGLHSTIVEENVEWLGVPTGIERGSFALTKIAALKNEPGYVVAGAEIREWRFLGVAYRNGEPWLYGPKAEGASLSQVLERPQQEALRALLELARSLALLLERGVPPFRLQSEAVIFLEGGGILFLPPPVMAALKDLRPLEYRLQAYEVINHPYATGTDAISFSIAALAYRVLTGEYPFTGESEQAIRDRVRRFRATPPHLVRPETRVEVSEFVAKALVRPAAVGLPDWVRALESWQREGVLRSLTDAERAELVARAREHRTRAERSLRSSLFFEKNGRLLLIVAAVLAVVAVAAGSILKNVLAPRVTSGFPPERVVETFYRSIGKLDHATMEDCVVDKAGKGEINEAISLFVISRQTMAYEGKVYAIDAAEWDAKGRPPVASPYFVHGVVGLKITREGDDERPVFLVEYERYARAFEDETVETAPPINGRKVTDRVYLRRDRGDWVIFRIDRLRTEPLAK